MSAARASVLILAGGSGTRFWPLSRREHPKQLLRLFEDLSLLQRTAQRMAPLAGSEDIWVCTTEALAAQVEQQLPDVPRAQILAEPMARNTAPAIAWAVDQMPAEVRQRPIVMLAADHYVPDEPAFCDAVAVAVDTAAREDRILTLGVVPRWAETGYGYLELEQELSGALEPQAVARFKEKPDEATAMEFYESGRHLWNAGNFVFRGDVLLERVARDLPELAQGLEALRQVPRGSSEALEIYSKLPRVSIDHGLMEHQRDLMTVPLDCGWNDVGSWQALAELLEPDASGNRVRGTALLEDARDNLVFEDPQAPPATVALLGVEGLAVVRTRDAVLVMPRELSQRVKEIVERLEREGREELL